MPTERTTASPATPNKLEVVRLEDRLNPTGTLTPDALLAFAPNPILDLGSTGPVAPVSPTAQTTTTTTGAAPATASSQYELLLPAVTVDPVTTDTSGGTLAFLSIVPPSAQLSGFVYIDEGEGGGVRDDGVKQAGEPGIPGATLTLLRVINGGTLTAGVTTTDNNGFYQFTGLNTTGEYRVIETQPAGFDDGKDTAGTVGGVTRGTAPQNDSITGVTLNANDNSINNNFGELVPANARLSGFVYVDEGQGGGTRDDGVKQPNEPGIGGTVVTLFRVVNGTPTSVAQTTTTAAGFYEFANLPAGTYEVREAQPAGFDDGKDTPGSTGGSNATNDRLTTIPLAAGQSSINNNFGELIQRGSLSGFVYVDEGANGGTRDDGVKQAGEPGIPGTTVTLFRVVNGQATSIAQTTTNAAGFYEFTNLPAGGGYLVRETQPAAFVDGKDTPGSTGGSNAVNDDLSAITVPANGASVNNNFGELVPTDARLSGFVYEDRNDSGVKDPTEAGINGVVVTLFRVVGGQPTSVAQATTDAAGFYEFANLPAGTYTVREAQPAAFVDGKDTPGSTGGSNATNDELALIPLAASQSSINNNFGERRGSISGFVYLDEGDNGGTRDDGVKQAGEPGIANVPVRLLRNGVVQATVTTGADGSYRFDDLLLGGGYTVEEVTQPAGLQDGKDTAGVPGGGTAGNEVISNITLTQGAPNSPNNNFGELLLPARLSGFVYEDNNNDGIKDPTEAGINGVVVTLFRVVNGTPTSVAQATTTAAGFYEFANLPAGTYEVRETQPANYLDGKDTPGTRGGSNAVNDRLSAVVLNPGDNAERNNFGELRPARLSGFEYVDEGANGGTRDDGVKQAGEPGIPGVVVTLTGTDDLGAVNRLATTAADGSYTFDNLRPGAYTVAAAQPPAFIDGKDTAGSKGGAVTNDQIAAIPLVAGDNSINNNFGELLVPGSLSGFVYEDNNDDGVKDANEAGIGGVTVTLFRVVNGQAVSVGQTTTTAAGAYQFTGLTPGGGYLVRQTQPTAYQDGKDTQGSTGGSNAVNDDLSAITVPANGASVNNNFGERLGQLSGFVYADEGANGGVRDDGVKQAGEAVIPGTVVTLFRLVNGTPTSVGQTTTDANGFYQFTRLAPGTYEVRETQPAGFNDGKDTPGAGNGATTTANDVIGTIGIGGANDLDAPNNNFGELNIPPLPARLSGFVYVDEGAGGGVRDDGVKQAGEPGIGGTVVTLFRVVNGTPTSVAQATTTAAGFYEFTDLPAGTYEVRETQPANFNDGKDTAGTVNGVTRGTAGNDVISAVALNAGENSVNNNFGELLPPPPPPPPVGAVSGFVYVDTNDNGVKDPGEAGIPGTVVRLTNNQITLTATTDGTGFYRFTGLTPGQYALVEAQPAGYLDGKDTPGTTGGLNPANDWLTQVTAPAGGESFNNNFGELLPPPPPPPPPPLVSLFGYVWYDQNRSATFDPSEIGLGGATVTLTGSTLAGLPVATAVTTTDQFGRYAFTGLPAGNYRVVQTNTPVGYDDFREENKSGLVVGGSTATEFAGIPLTRDAGPLNFGKVNDFIIVVPPPPNPQNPDPSKLNFLGSTGGTTATVPPPNPGQQLPSAPEPGLTPNTPVGPTGAGVTPRLNAVGSGPGSAAVVRVFDASTGGERFRLRPFGDFTGGVTTAVADVNKDGVSDIIVGAGANGGPRVSVFDGLTGAVLYDFYAYSPTFTGGVFVAAGDVDGDGYGDIITGAGAGGGPHVKAFSGKTGAEIASFYAFAPTYTGGVWVAAGNFAGDGRVEIAAGTGAGVAGQVAVIDPRSLAVLNTFQPFGSFAGGLNMAAGDVTGDGIAEVIVGAGANGGPRVRVMSAATGASVYDFFAYAQSFTGGVSVAAHDLNADGKAEIITGSGIGSQGHVQVFSGANLAPLDSFYGFESSHKNGVYVG